ncbi:MAG: BatD family protein [Planctomycetaceae bacterium]|nr:BatD family protein [Planctomycetaceae bacterium]
MSDVNLTVLLDRSTVYEGETLFYELILSDTKPIDTQLQPDISALTDFTVEALPKQQEQSGGVMQKIVINGKVIKDETSGKEYRVHFCFVLTPKKTGSLVIPLPRIIPAGGNALQPAEFVVRIGETKMQPDGSVPIQVVIPEKQNDDVLLEITANRTKLYPQQPLELTLTVLIKALPGRFGNRNPLELINKPPVLQVPWMASDAQLPKGLTPVKPMEALLQSWLIQSDRGGFSINGFSGNQSRIKGFTDDLFAGPFGTNPFKKALYQFSGAPKKIRRYAADGLEYDYWEYRFRRDFLPKETGEYSFGPVTLKGGVPVGTTIQTADSPDPVQLKTLFAAAKALHIAVIDVPAANRPADYIGAFGTFRFETDIKPQKAKIGDPITLTLKLTGNGSTLNVKAPDLSLPAIHDVFRVHTPPTEEHSEQSCIYTYTLRPKQSGKIEFPPLPVSVFDVETEKFVRLESLPITLDITDAETVQSATVYGAISGSTAEQTEANVKKIADRAVTVSKYIGIGIGTLLGLYVLGKLTLWTAVFIKRSRNNRRNSALRRAGQQLSAAERLTASIPAVDKTLQVKALQSVFFGYAADKTDGIAEGMTTSEAAAKLRELHLDETLVTEIQQLLETLDAVQYGGHTAPELNSLIAETKKLLQRIDN